MNATMKKHAWSSFLTLFGEQNRGRATRLGVFEPEFGGATDYWIEDDLPLAGIDVDATDQAAPTVEMMLGDAARPDFPHLTHVIAKARTVKIILSANGESDGLEIEDAAGKTTILRFEN